MTEDNARKKQCPQTRLESGSGTFNRTFKRVMLWFGKSTDVAGVYPDNSCNCIASDCMMWEWDTRKGAETVTGTGFTKVTICKEGTGHCGLCK